MVARVRIHDHVLHMRECIIVNVFKRNKRNAKETEMRKISLSRIDVQVDTDELLEELVDRLGLNPVVESLARMCAEKAEHIRSNWQDEPLAKRWDKRMMILDMALATLIKNWSDTTELVKD